MGISFAFSTAARADSPTPEVTYPSDGPVFSIGQPITILWTGGTPEGSVSVDLIDDTFYQVVSNVTPDTPNDGNLDWTVPANLICGHTYRFYIQDKQPKWSYGHPFTVECGAPVTE